MKIQTRRVQKPWGREEIWAETQDYVAKRMYINPGHRMSLQYHEKKEETIMVLAGTLRIWSSKDDEDFVDLRPGDCYHVNPNQIHRFGSPSEDEYATVIMEVSTPFLNDVVRLHDDYSRTL